MVTRFLKKAAPNLTQELSVYIPSKRLPIMEQKRMLGKQLGDFLHIYRKDTEQMRIALSAQLDLEKKRHRSRIIDETQFQTLVYKCGESELEQIMSAYMRTAGPDSSIFLGVSSNKSEAEFETSNPIELNGEIKHSSGGGNEMKNETNSDANDTKKSFYDEKLNRRGLNSRLYSAKKKVDRTSSNSRLTYFESQPSSVAFSRSSRSRSRSRSSVSSTRSNENIRNSRYAQLNLSNICKSLKLKYSRHKNRILMHEFYLGSFRIMNKCYRKILFQEIFFLPRKSVI